MKPIYLDYNATTPVDKEVARAMLPFLESNYGNPSSSHWFGTQTRKAVEQARRQVAKLINCEVDEIIFTSGGTESNNFAIIGSVRAHQDKGNHIITTMIEHPAVLEVCRYLQKNGFEITFLPVDQTGLVDLSDIEKAIRKETILISVMHANNEVGTIQPIAEISRLAESHNIIFHTDAAQSVGKIKTDVQIMGVDLLSIAGHKLYAPKGIGALFIKRGVLLQKILFGADHEQNLRPGTENVLEIVGLGKACEIAKRDLDQNYKLYSETRDRLQQGLFEGLDNLHLNGHPEKRLPNTLSVSFPGIEANLILAELKGIAASAGAACHSDQVEMSHVLQAMQIPVETAMGTIRFSTGKHTTYQDVDDAIASIIGVISKLTSKKGSIPEKLDGDIKLTNFTAGLGCACKLRPQALENILSDMPLSIDPKIMVGSSTSDDAAVYRLNDEIALVQTVDFFTPIVDDPYQFGVIAAANSLSDIYAMGAKPVFALNIVAFPSNRLPISILKEIISGAREKTGEAGIEIVGGHTIDDPEPKFGLVVLGLAHPDKILLNSKAKPDDAIILTKPIGTGILATANKRGLTEEMHQKKLYEIMSELNAKAAEIMEGYPVSSCTDVTGFGLIGHLKEITIASKVNAEIYADRVPYLEGALDFIAANIVPGGTLNNLDYVSSITDWEETVPYKIRILLCDAQTSGGLLICVPDSHADSLLLDLHENGVSDSAIIGRFTSRGQGKIRVRNSDQI